MCEHGGTEVFNLGQNNLALVPEFPFSLVISKMREVNLIKSMFSSICLATSLSSMFLLVIIIISIRAIFSEGEPDQCPHKPWTSKITVDSSGRCVNSVHPQNQWEWPLFSARSIILAVLSVTSQTQVTEMWIWSVLKNQSKHVPFTSIVALLIWSEMIPPQRMC